MRYLTFFIIPMLLCCNEPKNSNGVSLKRASTGKQAEALIGTEIGIESIVDNGDGTLDVSVYMYTTVPVAGFQADLLPKEYFTIENVFGGLGEEMGFMMKGGKSTFLGFSIKGDVISKSESRFLSDNVLCVLKAKKKQDLILPLKVGLDPIIAGKKGVKLQVVTKPFVFE